ncbi:long-chain-fatty-acid--CoA ligase [Arthrobacter antibioticus]|uniref:long-chain-fatty-acid--CoA ligase n=2 Tax=unclassified Arthrobacter TaxID=235627 RepID=UPI0024B94C5E|nr:long-chain-fatty-acid--CoA ligase [Arthrobacter sp. H35-MC1]MDJ0318820.1 long-chain-fatty-acid--CoA ligase [Arthrobacter sp. H35-MC1]
MNTKEIVSGHPSTMGDDVQLNTTTLIRHAARTHGEREIVYRTAGGGWDRYNYAEAYDRIKRGANALRSLGVGPATRVGIIDWNSRRHFELYWAIPGLAAVMVQLNLRLGPEDLSYVIKDSDTSLICVDESLLPLAEAVAPSMPSVTTWIIMSDKPMSEITTTLPNAHHYEELLAASEADIHWPEIDEHSAYSACYTTGTTGRPKGVFYSHRAIYLHSYAIAANVGMTLDDCTMLITPMFHGQAWGLPQAAALMANKIVLPGRYMAEDTGPLTDALIDEGVTITNGAPVIFIPMLQYIETLEVKPDLSNLRMLSGATEPPLTLMRGFENLTGAETVHAYGATETTPLVTMNRYKASVRARLTPAELLDLKRKQGLPVSGVEIRLVDGSDQDVQWDGVTQGEICVRGPWVTRGYHNMLAEDAKDRFVDGYWRSGDVGTIDPDGYLKVTDRIKDVIKSGGEWISSIDMENLLLNHPNIAEAAVVGLPHPKWQERPFVLVVPRSNATVDIADIRSHLSSAFAAWQLPEAMTIVTEIPRTSVGKFDKKTIRSQHASVYAGSATSEYECVQAVTERQMSRAAINQELGEQT